MDEHLQKIIDEMLEDGYTKQESIQWVIDDPEKLFTEEFKEFAKLKLREI